MDKTILVVDDDENILNLIEICLSDRFSIKKAKSAEDALKIVNEMSGFGPDLLLLDLMMPNMNGEELCREIRKVSDVPIIFLSAKDQREAFLHDPVLRVSGYINKPFDPDDLIRKISGYLT